MVAIYACGSMVTHASQGCEVRVSVNCLASAGFLKCEQASFGEDIVSELQPCCHQKHRERLVRHKQKN